ncbi:MAG: HEAT repeat domain-containing protein [Planctomycetes bacterium]|nr:HEAT repeat domain-containing protein [Planctomycetota bacterium]
MIRRMAALVFVVIVAGCARPSTERRGLSAEKIEQVNASLGRIRRGADVDEAYAIEDAFVALGAAAVPVLAKNLVDADDDVRFHVVRALARLRTRDAALALVEALKDRRASARIEAELGLAEILDGSKPVEVTELVARFTNDTDPVVKNTAAYALAKLGWRVGVPTLVENLDAKLWPRSDADRRLREISGKDCHFDPFAGETDRRAAVACWQEWRDGYTPMFDDLIRSLGLYKFLMSDYAKKTLIKLGRPAIPHLRRALGDGNAYVRTHSIEILDAIGAAESLVDVRRCLGDAFAPARAAAAAALGKFRDPEPGVGLARAATSDPDASVRCAAVAALADIATEAAIAPLARALEHDAGVREIAMAARAGLLRAGRAAGIPEAIAALTGTDEALRDQARKRLGELLGDAVPTDAVGWWRSIEASAP